MNTSKISMAAVLALGAFVAPSAHAITGCSTNNLYGFYSMQFSGTSSPAMAKGLAGVALPPDAARTAAVAAGSPATGIGRISFDGAGEVAGNSSVNVQGAWLQGSVTGQYNVNSDCTLSLTLTDSRGESEQFSGVAVGSGETIYVVQTDSGTGIVGVLKRTRGYCQVSDLVGSYAFSYSGNPVGSASAYSSVGLLTLDGSGAANATEWRFASGSASQVISSGTFTVNPDCSASLALTSSDSAAKTITFSGMISADERQMTLVQSDAGTATAGSVIAQ